MKKNSLPALALAGLAAGLLAAPASGQITDQWKFGAAVYGWFPSLSGDTTFPPRQGGSSITVDADTILSDLKFVFMGSFEARKGRWGVFTDFIYMDLGDSRSISREFAIGGVPLPGGVDGNAKYDIKGTVWTLAGQYTMSSTPEHDFNVVGGFRMLDLDQKLSYDLTGNVSGIPPIDRSGSREADTTNWDAIVGVKGRFNFGKDRKWYVPYYLDVGAGDSDLTWQAVAGLGYHFGWGNLFVNWRYLDYDIGKAIETINFSGPSVGVSFSW